MKTAHLKPSRKRPFVLAVSTSSETTPFTLELPPDLIVHEPDELRRELLAALATGRSVVLDVRETHRVGIVGLQLLLAFLREAREKGVAARLSGVRAELAEALRCTGLDQHPDLRRACGRVEPDARD